MSKTLNKIIFFGNERLATGINTATPVLKALIDAGYDVAAVVVAQESMTTSRTNRSLEIADTARQNGIKLLSPTRPALILDELRSLGADIGILVAYGKLIPSSLIDIFPRGIINLHPSLLPSHRGPTPIESTILDGDSTGGVTLMQLSSQMDSGPIFGQVSLKVSDVITKQQLADKLLAMGKDLLLGNLSKILDGSLTPEAQTNERISYDRLLQKSDAYIDISKSAIRLEREVRAYANWPRSRYTFGNTEVIINQASVVLSKGKPGDIYREHGQLGVFTADGVLQIERLTPVGKREMDSAAFLRGYHV